MCCLFVDTAGMGWINRRGSASKPRYVCYYVEGTNPDGSPRVQQQRAAGAQTKKQARDFLAAIEARIARGEPAQARRVVIVDMGALLSEWSEGITNRKAVDDRRIVVRDLVPAFKGYSLEQVTVPVILAWLDELAKGSLAGGSQLHRLNLLSRFFSWAVNDRELLAANPCRSIRVGRRPQANPEKRLWLEDDTMVPKIMEKLVSVPSLDLLFYLARFSGIREGEAAGLRMSDLDFLSEGLLRVRYSYFGPLKEHSSRHPKVSKMVPAPSDALEVLKLHLKRRKLQGAKGEDLVFTYDRSSKRRKGAWKTWPGFHPHTIQSEFRDAADSLGLPKDLDFYGATRHTYATKALMAGASLDEVSSALGHSSPLVTLKHYSHLVRKTYSSTLRQGLAK